MTLDELTAQLPTAPPHSRLKTAADELYWCLEDRYRADGDSIIKGPNELVAFYSRPSPVEAAAIAEALEGVVAPVRRRRAAELLAEIEALIAAVRDQW